jgi:hypothetical protein
VILDSTADPENNAVSTRISHFSLYTILARTAPASFAIADLKVTPEQAFTGENVTASITVSNDGDLSGNYTIDLKVDGEIVQTKEITVGGRSTETVTFNLPTEEAGTHSVSIGDLEATYEVKTAKTTASFTTGGLIITPGEIKAGEQVTISVTVSNTGETEGTYSVTLKVNDKVAETKETTLAGGATGNVAFTSTGDKAGTYVVDVNGATGSFTVTEGIHATIEPREALPDNTSTKTTIWITVGVICALLIAGLVFYLLQRKKPLPK